MEVVCYFKINWVVPTSQATLEFPDERERNGRARGQVRRKEEITDSEGMHKGW